MSANDELAEKLKKININVLSAASLYIFNDVLGVCILFCTSTILSSDHQSFGSLRMVRLLYISSEIFTEGWVWKESMTFKSFTGNEILSLKFWVTI